MILESSYSNGSLKGSPVEFNSEIALKRKEVRYENHSKRFLCLKRDFKKQFAHIYAGRLNALKSRLISSSSAKWGNWQVNCLFYLH